MKNITIEKRKGSFYKLKSGNYRLTYMYQGKTYRETFNDIESDFEAEIKLRKFVEEIESGNYDSNNITVATWAQTWIDKYMRPKVSGQRGIKKIILFLNNRFLPYFGNKKLKDITMENLNDYFNWLKKQKTMYKNRENTLLSEGSLIRYHNMIHSMFECAYLWKKIPSNPCPTSKMLNFKINSDGTRRNTTKNSINEKIENDVKYFSKPDYDKALNLIEEQENEIILDQTLSEKEKHFYYGRLLAIEIDFKTGLRRSELFGLTKTDFDLDNLTMKITKTRQLTKDGTETLDTKNLSSSRIVSIPKSLVPKLMYFFNITPSHFDYIFEDLSIDGISSYWSAWQTKNGFNKIRFHDIRHTHASILFYMGVDIHVVAQRLGHASVSTTEKNYLFIIRELRQKVSSQINDL